LKTLHSGVTITAFIWINLDRFSLLASIHIQPYGFTRCIAAVYRATAWYAKAVEAANLTREVGNFAPNPCFTRF